MERMKKYPKDKEFLSHLSLVSIAARHYVEDHGGTFRHNYQTMPADLAEIEKSANFIMKYVITKRKGGQ